MPSRTDLLIWSTQVARCLFYRGLSDFYRATDLATGRAPGNGWEFT
jgi:hypothetical protein